MCVHCTGGLCRTSEILGVGALTVASLAALQERDFTGVSVTAEQWLPIKEVPVDRSVNSLSSPSERMNTYTASMHPLIMLNVCVQAV